MFKTLFCIFSLKLNIFIIFKIALFIIIFLLFLKLFGI